MWRLTGEGTSEVYKSPLFMARFVIPNWMSQRIRLGSLDLLQVNKHLRQRRSGVPMTFIKEKAFEDDLIDRNRCVLYL